MTDTISTAANAGGQAAPAVIPYNQKRSVDAALNDLDARLAAIEASKPPSDSDIGLVAKADAFCARMAKHIFGEVY